MVFIDANVLLELILPNRQRASSVATELNKLTEQAAISTLSVHLIMHFGRRERIHDSTLHKIIEQYAIVPLEAEDYKWACANEIGKDFEDALQVSSALRAGCNSFMTLDQSLAKNYHGRIDFITP